MKDVFESMYLLIPLAIVLFARVFFEGMRARANERKTPTARPVGSSLFVRVRDYLSGWLGRPLKKPTPSPSEEAAVTRLGGYGQPMPVRVQARTNTNTTGPHSGSFTVPVASASKKQRSVGTHAFPARLTRLTPLKKAVVLSELLGKPKALQ